MKRLFRKNQIIITSLAIMIVIAGYLNFTADQTKPVKQEAAAETAEKIREENIQAEEAAAGAEADITSFRMKIWLLYQPRQRVQRIQRHRKGKMSVKQYLPVCLSRRIQCFCKIKTESRCVQKMRPLYWRSSIIQTYRKT